MAVKRSFCFVKIISHTYIPMQRGHIHSPSGAQESPKQSRWSHFTGNVGLLQAIIPPYSPWPQKQNCFHFLQKIYIIFVTNIILLDLFFSPLKSYHYSPWCPLQCDLNSFCMLLQRLFLHLHILTSSFKSVSLASASFSKPDRLQYFLLAFFSASAINADGGLIFIPCLPRVW